MIHILNKRKEKMDKEVKDTKFQQSEIYIKNQTDILIPKIKYMKVRTQWMCLKVNLPSQTQEVNSKRNQ